VTKGGPERKPRGRRPGESTTRDAILEAARRHFAAEGFDGTTIRAIARDASVDPALVMHFFGSKELMFAAAMELPFDAASAVGRLLESDRATLGAEFARMFFRIWEDSETGPAMVGLLRSASSHDAAAARMRELLDGQILQPLATALDAPDRQLRSDLASSQLVGIGLMRYVLRLEPLASTDTEILIAALAPTLQRYLTGELDAVSGGAQSPLFNKR
jgi:AcrR family transcriptional regulator